MPKGFHCRGGYANLITTLSEKDRELLSPHLEPVELPKDFVLEHSFEQIDKVYFITSGVVSTVVSSKNGRQIEVGLFGCEGMSGIGAILQGGRSPHESFMQIGGEGFAMSAGELQSLMAASSTIRRQFLRYAQVMMTQTSQTALSNGQAKLEERLARWLLMCHDRVEGNELDLTHEFLSIMLGVRRAGVTVGIHILEGKGLIRALRGQVTILDREGLEDVAKYSYGLPEAEYVRLIGFPKGTSDNRTS
jgi:CRP-like cAMP-binding protein